jgi:hypothetical protein
VAGSDAIVHSLARLEFASECLGDAAQMLDAAADHNLFTDDLFYHQTQSAERLRKLRKDERAGLPPDLPANATESASVFEPANDGIPDRYRTHPTHQMRERNAKRRYVRSPQDDRSPWILFRDSAALKRTVTEQFYKHGLRRIENYEPRPAEEVQRFIDSEHRESTFDEKYQGFYDERLINPGDLTTPPETPWPKEQVVAWLADWPPANMSERIAAHQGRRREYDLLSAMQSGALALKSKTFPFRDQQCTRKDIERLLAQVDEELGADHKGFHEWDREAFLAHWSLARILDDSNADHPRERELVERYRFHMAAQGLMQGLFGERARLQSVLAYLGQHPRLEEREFQQVMKALREIHHSLVVNLEDAKKYTMPALANVAAGSSLYSLIVDRGDGVLPELEGQTLTGDWINLLITRLEGVIGRVKRLHFKSLGSLLTFQEKLREEQVSGASPAPDGAEVEREPRHYAGKETPPG